MQYKGAIFDMDGLLFDTERIYQETWQEIAREKKVELGSDFVRDISGTSGDNMNRVIEQYYHVCDGRDIKEDCMERVKDKLFRCVPVKKGVHEILDYFKEKEFRVAVASSSAVSQIESNLKTAGVREYFSKIVSGTEVKQGKPAPDIFLLAAKRIDLEPEECFVFEDSANGIKAGKAAGCITVMVPDLIEASPEIIPYCTMVCSDLIQAQKRIKKFID